jgi:tRNA uridine 5-carboxymethylaminomethyl modification enzyme
MSLTTALGWQPISQQMTAADLLCRPGVRYQEVQELVGATAASSPLKLEAATDLPALDERTAALVETMVKYAGYIQKEESSVARARRQEERQFPAAFDFGSLPGLRTEARQHLERVRPRTLGQASRLPGVTPADISILLVQLERLRRSARPEPTRDRAARQVAGLAAREE